MKVAFIGCGYIADKYLRSLLECHPGIELAGVTDRDVARARKLADHYGTRRYSSVAELLADPAVGLVVNLTDPASHYEVSKAALLAGKHVYSEKPMALRNDEAQELVGLADERRLALSGAPCSLLGPTAQTLWSHVEAGAVGTVRLVYAELDDNPIHLMKPELWTNSHGVPWPVATELETGCTLEHGSYHLSWLCAMFGPALEVDSFATHVGSDSSGVDGRTPNVSVGVVTFRSGVVARLTFSVFAPYDHRIKVIGDEGVLTVDECWNETSPVYLERYSQLSLNARKLRTVRSNKLLQRLTGVGGAKLPLSTGPVDGEVPSHGWRAPARPRRSLPQRIRNRELISLDFCRGVADMAQSVESGREASMPAQFCLHVNELALAIQDSRKSGGHHRMQSTFSPLRPGSYHALPAASASSRLQSSGAVEHLIGRLHRH